MQGTTADEVFQLERINKRPPDRSHFIALMMGALGKTRLAYAQTTTVG